MIIIYIWSLQAKRAGEDASQLGLDPFMELQLTLTNNHDKLRQIKRIRKEQELIQKWKEHYSDGKEIVHQHFDKDGNLIEQNEAGEPIQQNAVDFLRALRKRTQATWSEKLSPEAVRRLFSTTRFGRIWMIFQVFCTIVAIVNYIILTYAIQRTDRKLVKRLDVSLAIIFAIDYGISLYTAEDRLRFYFNPSSLIDLLSIIPTFVYFLVRDSGNYVWFVGLLRILRATRVLSEFILLKDALNPCRNLPSHFILADWRKERTHHLGSQVLSTLLGGAC